MRSTHSFDINFIKRNCSGDKNKAFIYARISVDGGWAEISLKEQINSKDWDATNEIVKGKTLQVKVINQHIEDVRFQIKAKYRMFQENGSLITVGKAICSRMIKNEFLRYKETDHLTNTPEEGVRTSF